MRKTLLPPLLQTHGSLSARFPRAIPATQAPDLVPLSAKSLIGVRCTPLSPRSLLPLLFPFCTAAPPRLPSLSPVEAAGANLWTRLFLLLHKESPFPAGLTASWAPPLRHSALALAPPRCLVLFPRPQCQRHRPKVFPLFQAARRLRRGSLFSRFVVCAYTLQ